jgi:hypothetical protein
MASNEDLPLDELVDRARELGLDVDDVADVREIRRLIERRIDWIEQLDRDALEEIARWANVPVRARGNNVDLFCKIRREGKMDFAGLSGRALFTLGLVRGIEVGSEDDEDTLRQKLRKAESLTDWLGRKSRSVLAKGVGGLVDPYVRRKMDEIEIRVDNKLDEIEHRVHRMVDEFDERLDARLEREVAHRLKIIRITLIISLIIALLSLGYAWVYRMVTGG